MNARCAYAPDPELIAAINRLSQIAFEIPDYRYRRMEQTDNPVIVSVGESRGEVPPLSPIFHQTFPEVQGVFTVSTAFPGLTYCQTPRKTVASGA